MRGVLGSQWKVGLPVANVKIVPVRAERSRIQVEAVWRPKAKKPFGHSFKHGKPQHYHTLIPNLKRKKLRTLKNRGIVTNRRQLTRRDAFYRHSYLSNFKSVWDQSVVNMVKFYRTELPLVREGYKYNARTLYYHKLITTERRKDNNALKRRDYRLWLWKKNFRTDKEADWSDETRRLARIYKPKYQKYKWLEQAETPIDRQLREQQSVRGLASKFHFLETIKKKDLGTKELVATLSTAGSVVAELEDRMMHSTASTEKRQALGFLERRVLGRLLENAEQLTLQGCATVLRAITQLSATEAIYERVLDALTPQVLRLVQKAPEPLPRTYGRQVVWVLYVIASCRQIREPPVELLKALVGALAPQLAGLHTALHWRVAQALAMVADVYLPPAQVVRQLHGLVDENLHKQRAAKLPMLLWVLVRHTRVVPPEPELLARVQDTMLEGLHRAGNTQSFVEGLFVLADVAPHVPVRRGIASNVAMQLQPRLGMLSRGQYRTVVRSLAALKEHIILPEGYLLALGRQPRLRNWQLDDGEAEALEKLGALMVDGPSHLDSLGVPDLTADGGALPTA